MFWVKAETLLYCALILHLVEAPPRIELQYPGGLINGMREFEEDDDEYLNPVDYVQAWKNATRTFRCQAIPQI